MKKFHPFEEILEIDVKYHHPDDALLIAKSLYNLGIVHPFYQDFDIWRSSSIELSYFYIFYSNEGTVKFTNNHPGLYFHNREIREGSWKKAKSFLDTKEMKEDTSSNRSFTIWFDDNNSFKKEQKYKTFIATVESFGFQPACPEHRLKDTSKVFCNCIVLDLAKKTYVTKTARYKDFKEDWFYKLDLLFDKLLDITMKTIVADKEGCKNYLSS